MWMCGCGLVSGGYQQLPSYYPAKAMDKDAVKWMDQAFIAGRIDHGEMVLRGSSGSVSI